jgi:hypothetical protein
MYYLVKQIPPAQNIDFVAKSETKNVLIRQLPDLIVDAITALLNGETYLDVASATKYKIVEEREYAQLIMADTVIW